MMEKSFMKKHSESNPQTLMGSNLDSLYKWQPILISFKEISQQFRESIINHVSVNRKTGIAFSINTSCRERIFGNINTDKKIFHTNTPNRIFLDSAVNAFRPILHSNKGSKTQSTYDGYGRQGTNSFEGSKTQMIWSSPAYPVLMGKTHIYKFYNTNS